MILILIQMLIFMGQVQSACAWLINEIIRSLALQVWCHTSVSVKNGPYAIVINRNRILLLLSVTVFTCIFFLDEFKGPVLSSEWIHFFPSKSRRYWKTWYAKHKDMFPAGFSLRIQFVVRSSQVIKSKINLQARNF